MKHPGKGVKVDDRRSRMGRARRSSERINLHAAASILDAVSRAARRLPGLLVPLVLLIAGCNPGEERADAYGNFEATEVLVSAEHGGTLVRFTVQEGEAIRAGALVGVVDTTQLVLQRRELRAQREAARSRIGQVRGEIDVLETELDVARTEQARIQRLVENEAATPQQLDDITGRVRVLTQRVEAMRTQLATIRSEIESIDAAIAQVEQRIDDVRVLNPVTGTVLTTYAEPHELVAQGAPLYEIADLGTMYLRAYVSGAQLPNVRLGQAVTVLIDENETDLRALDGTVSWIADEAEFTPQTIQTREERVNLVYAIKVRVPNPDGTIKIGMPGEVVFGRGSVGARERGG